MVSFSKEGEIKVGDAAKRQAALNPDGTIYNIKRLMGRRFDEVKDIIKDRPYKIVNNKGRAAIEINIKDGDTTKTRIYTPEEISAMILQKMKKTAEDYLGYEVKRAVITCPAFYGSDMRQAVKDAGEIAGLKVERVIAEPTAAALNVKDITSTNKVVAVVDFGGCTFDVSIIEAGDGVFEVLSTDGDLDLGGNLLDSAIVDHLVEVFSKKNDGLNLKKDPMAYSRILEAAEKAKIELSASNETEINLPYITMTGAGPLHLMEKITRSQFEKLVDSILERPLKHLKTALEKSSKKIEDIQDILLVGGTTRVPAFQQKLEKAYGRSLNKSLNPDTAVATGAAIQGAVLDGDVKDILLLDVLPISIGIETYGGVFTKMIEANTTIPTKKEQVFSTASDSQPSVQINLLQGERALASDNKALGTFHLDGIPPAPRGVPQIEVSVDISADGILSVSARDKGTGKENKIRIEGSSQLSKEDIEKMKKDAEANEEADRKTLENIKILNDGDSLVFQSEKMLKDNTAKVSEEEKAELEKAISSLKESVTKKEVAETKTKTETLQQLIYKLSEKLYAQSQADGNATTVDVDDATEVDQTV